MLLNSPTRRGGVGLTLLSVFSNPVGILLYNPFQILHVLPQVSSTPEDFAFVFPHFLLLLKEAFNPASVLDHAWQKLEDLLKIRDNEKKQED